MSDYFSNDSETVLKKNEKKKKLHKLLDKYGSVEEIEKNAIGADGYEYMFANTDNLIEEVLKERRSEQSSLSRIRQETPQQRNTLLPEDDDFSLDGLNLSDKQRKAIKNLDMTNQLTMIKALREEQNIEKPRSKTDSIIEKIASENKPDNDFKIHNAPKQYADETHKKQYASNEYMSVKSDAEVENSKNDEMEIKNNIFNHDKFIHQTMRPIIEKNEGLFAYPYLDTECKVTIGVGANIDKAELNEDWYYKDPETKKLRHLDKNNPEDLALIKSELKKLQDEIDKLPRDENGKPKNNYKAEYFEKITNLRISDEHLNNLYDERAKEAVKNIKDTIKRYNKDSKKEHTIPDFEKLPQPLQIVLMEMMYNMGGHRFDCVLHKDGKGFPKFWDYLAKKDVYNMIEQSKRGGISKDRNDEIAGYLRQLHHFKDWKKPLE